MEISTGLKYISPKQIPLTKGYVALVDDADYERVSALKWQAFLKPRSVYASMIIYGPGGSRTRIWMHSFIMGKTGIDHADTDGLNNQRHNLRPANQTQQNANKRKLSRTGQNSRFKGVTKERGRWRAAIKVNGVKKHLAICSDEVDAATIYNFAAFEEFGEFARFNTPEMGMQ